MEHLLTAVANHDLSLCFRHPVDLNTYKDYAACVSSRERMDLATMQTKAKAGRYDGDRRKSLFEDFRRMWRSSRWFAGCDVRGKPIAMVNAGGSADESPDAPDIAVPGIVRCVYVLERLVQDYVQIHMPGQAPLWWSTQQSFDPNPHCAYQWSRPENLSRVSLSGRK